MAPGTPAAGRRAQPRGWGSRQLADFGFSTRKTSDWVRQGRLFRVHRGVYLLGDSRISREGELLAAVLACGDGAALSAAAALEVWGAVEPSSRAIDVSSPTCRRARPGLRTHEARLGAADLGAIDSILLTLPARSLLDFAMGATPDALEAALDELRAAVHGYEVDLCWPEQGVALEFDSRRHHAGDTSAFERDRAKSTDLEAAQITVLRITWHQLTNRREWLIARIATTLATRQSSANRPADPPPAEVS